MNNPTADSAKTAGLSPHRIAEISGPARVAIVDVARRRQWIESKLASPVVTVELCDEIVRLNMVNCSLLQALQTALHVAGEARAEWDAAPHTMKAGKLLIALIDPTLKYRADITAMHATLATAKSGAA